MGGWVGSCVGSRTPPTHPPAFPPAHMGAPTLPSRLPASPLLAAPPPLQVDYVFPDNANISAECRDLIGKILVANPAQRITIADIFQHPWVQQASSAQLTDCSATQLALPVTMALHGLCASLRKLHSPPTTNTQAPPVCLFFQPCNPAPLSPALLPPAALPPLLAACRSCPRVLLSTTTGRWRCRSSPRRWVAGCRVVGIGRHPAHRLSHWPGPPRAPQPHPTPPRTIPRPPNHPPARPCAPCPGLLPPQTDDEVKAVVSEVHLAGKQQRAAEMGVGGGEEDDYLTSQDLADA